MIRAYSIASAPDGNRFELCLNEVKEGVFSPHLFSLEPGATVEMRGPLGHFVWRTPPRDSFLVATGTGIAPFRGMLQHQLPRDPDTRYTLIFGARYEHGLLYLKEFEQLAREHPNFVLQATITRPSASWTGRTGRVQPHLEEALGERRDVDVYICGMKEMVDQVRALLKERGFDRKQIIYEKYD